MFKKIIPAIQFPAISITARAMSGIQLPVLLEKLNEFAPQSRAEPWDNVGLLLEPPNLKSINKILLTNDLTEPVMQEAIKRQANFIISYHPPIFAPLKRLVQSDWKSKIIMDCISSGIGVFSPHTSWDNTFGGVNDWLLRSLGDPEKGRPITESGSGRFLELHEPITIQKVIQKVKDHTGLPALQVALAVGSSENSEIKSVALCAGSGTSVLKGIVADLYLTGEMSHHEVLDANHKGTTCILLNHSNSERGFLKDFKEKLGTLLGKEANVDIILSEFDADPLKVA